MSKSTSVKFTCLVLIIAFSLTANAQTISIQKSPPLKEASPARAGMSAERLSRIDDMCEKAVRDGDIPGVVCLVARDAKIVYWKAFGMADNQRNRPLEKNDIFRIASQSKAITATAVMMLWEEGRFDLDDPISKYIPAFKNPQVLESFQYSDTSYTTVDAKREISIRHLLAHTSGLGYGRIDGDERFRMIYQKAGITDLFTTENIPIGENVQRLAKLPLHHHPGERYRYCEGLDVLGYFIEIVSGVPLDVFLKERLFDPLGMQDTWFYLPETKSDRLVAVQHKSDDGEWCRYPVTFYDPDYPIKGARRFFSGGAGLCSTAKDYATFLQMYINGGELNGIRFLSRTTIETMMSNQIGDLWGSESDKYFGLAFAVVNENGQKTGGLGSVGTFDWSGYFNTAYFADPKERIVAVIMKQTRGPVSDDTGWKFRLLVGQSIDD